jgi:hypothetical protein
MFCQRGSLAEQHWWHPDRYEFVEEEGDEHVL